MTKVFQCPWPISPLQQTSILDKQNSVCEESGISRFSLTFVFEPEVKPQCSDVFYRFDLRPFQGLQRWSVSTQLRAFSAVNRVLSDTERLCCFSVFGP